jgi:hypothetical protein
MQDHSYQPPAPLAEQILEACGAFTDGSGALAAMRFQLAIDHMCEVVDREGTGWLQVYGECAEAANVEPHSVALLAAQEAVELVVAGYLDDEDKWGRS